MFRVRALLLLAVIFAFCQAAVAQPWETVDPAKAGWSVEKLGQVELVSQALKPTALMIAQNGKIVAAWGQTDRKVNAASVRKSLLSALYGIAVADGKIDLSSTLEELGIDDRQPRLTPEEKRATVRDLLTARSGIYHAAAHETADMKRKRPDRGSHPPGTFWFYNNWDFNTLGTIYRQRTGEDIFDAFERRIARPIGMEDFSAKDGRYVSEKSSDHPAYTFRLSARDAARFGQLFLNRGLWDAKQVVPAAWVKESATPYSLAKRLNQGYGYMWWVLPADVWGADAVYASGYGGQIIAIIPAKRLVVVQTVDLKQNPKGVRTSAFIDLLKQIADAAP